MITAQQSAMEDSIIDDNGNVAVQMVRNNLIIDNAEMILSVALVEKAINEVISNSVDADGAPQLIDENVTINNCSVPCHEMREFTSELSEEALIGKISASIGSTRLNKDSCPLFTTTLDEIEDVFSLIISSTSTDNVSG